MNRVFVDTSAIFALLVPTDVAHKRAAAAFEQLKAKESVLCTTSYVLVETYALIGKRFGRDAVKSFRSSFDPILDVTWIDRETHERGLSLMLERPVGVSLVDAVSFLTIEEQRVDAVLAFDRHFEQEGFRLVASAR